MADAMSIAVHEKRRCNNLVYMGFRRIMIFADEWLFYFTLIYLYLIGAPVSIMFAVVILGTSMIITAYLNLQELGDAIGLNERMFLWPIF